MTGSAVVSKDEALALAVANKPPLHLACHLHVAKP
jgi:hypothetical protein